MDQRLSEYIGSPLEAWTIEYRVHATQRMFKRGMEEKDVTLLLANPGEQLSRITMTIFLFQAF